jgi:hypothetical protein
MPDGHRRLKLRHDEADSGVRCSVKKRSRVSANSRIVLNLAESDVMNEMDRRQMRVQGTIEAGVVMSDWRR